MEIITLTMNPVLDKNTSAKLIVPEKKIRCAPPSYAPGGGGVNVSRAIKKLGGDSLACFLAGGENGKRMISLLDQEGVKHRIINSEAETRENLIVYDETTNNLFRFGMPGDPIEEEAWQKVFNTLETVTPKPEYLVASGSLPPGIPDDFYAQLAAFAKKNQIRMVLDTSGPAYKKALEEGVYMIKPNLGEMAYLLDKEVITGIDQERAAIDIMQRKQCEVVILSLGAKGAMLASEGDKIEYITTPTMPVISAVGAGDSMVAGILIGLSQGYTMSDAVRYGVAAGSAAAMTPGSELCRKEDADQIYDWFSSNLATVD